MVSTQEQENSGGFTSREKMIQDNIKLMYMVANRFLNRGIEPDDLYQIAAIGLIKAVDNFNSDFNVRFSTYAVPVIMGEIKRYLRDNSTVHISRALKILAYKACALRDKIVLTTGKEPSIKEIAEILSSTPEEISVALSAIQAPASLDEATDENKTTLKDNLKDEKNNIDVEVKLTIKQLIQDLPEREQNIIRWRYLNEYTQLKVANLLGISQVQVSRLEKKILTHLRTQLS